MPSMSIALKCTKYSHSRMEAQYFTFSLKHFMLLHTLGIMPMKFSGKVLFLSPSALFQVLVNEIWKYNSFINCNLLKDIKLLH